MRKINKSTKIVINLFNIRLISLIFLLSIFLFHLNSVLADDSVVDDSGQFVDFSSLGVVRYSSGFESEYDIEALALALCFEINKNDLTDQDTKTEMGFLEYYETNRDKVDTCYSFLEWWDSDGDWYGDSEEIAVGSDPNDEKSFPEITQIQLDGFETDVICVHDDGLCMAGYEEACFDLLDGAYDTDCLDLDKDGHPAFVEFIEGTDPDNGLSYPWWIDLDDDAYSNLRELRAGTDPLSGLETPGWSDSDKDGFSNHVEISEGADPYDSDSYPYLENRFPVVESVLESNKNVEYQPEFFEHKDELGKLIDKSMVIRLDDPSKNLWGDLEDSPFAHVDFVGSTGQEFEAGSEITAVNSLGKKSVPWQIYLAIALGVLLIVILAIYFIYYNKER